MSDFIKLIELANTWQGEGPDTGRQMLIARFKNCNLKCPYCDTWIKMQSSVDGNYSIDEINVALDKTKGLMITGGEPTFKDNYDQTLQMLKECKYQIANVETNGFRLVDLLSEPYIKNMEFLAEGKNIHFMYSPKVYTETLFAKERKNIVLFKDHPLVYYKIVVDCEVGFSADLIREAAELTSLDRGKIFLMPEGVTPEEIRSSWGMTINMADKLNLNLSSRLHIMNDFT